MSETKIFVPIENLVVERDISIGHVILRSSTYAKRLIEDLSAVVAKTRYTEEEKHRIIAMNSEDVDNYFGNSAIAELSGQADTKGELVPGDLSGVYDTVRTALAVLYVMQKKIAGIFSIEHQKFGIRRDAWQSISAVAGMNNDEGRFTLKLMREGNSASWEFPGREIDRLASDSTYAYLSNLLTEKDKSELARRALSAVVWLYDAALDFSPTGRHIKLTIVLETLFATRKRKKEFSISRFSVLLDHACIFPGKRCQCPILDSHSHEEYVTKCEELGLPGICSGYWNNYKWYEARCDIVHSGQRSLDLKELDSLDWWTHKLFFAFIEATIESGEHDIDGLERFLERKYGAVLASRQRLQNNAE